MVIITKCYPKIKMYFSIYFNLQDVFLAIACSYLLMMEKLRYHEK